METHPQTLATPQASSSASSASAQSARWQALSASVRGSMHRYLGLPNQDAVESSAAVSDGHVTVLAVSDGHGGGRHFRSQTGSRLAVRTAVQRLQAELPGIARDPGWTRTLCQSILEAWRQEVRRDLERHPFTSAEMEAVLHTDGPTGQQSVVRRPELAYGATLLVAAAEASRILYLQIGDGDLLAVQPDGSTVRPIPVDPRLVMHQTTSLCQLEALDEFRFAVVEDPAQLPELVLLSTDGYVNSFPCEQEFLQIGGDYLQLLRRQGPLALAGQLPQILSVATEQGSGDDITLGMLLRNAPQPPNSASHAMDSSAVRLAPSTTLRALEQTRELEARLDEQERLQTRTGRRMALLRLLLVLLAVAAAVAWGVSLWRSHRAQAGQQSPAVEKQDDARQH
ncbi:MAG: protein phosphatase 2C domain-containing protein [Acidobacteriota bacterium]|nr:protein phosphatase 2C domain-containing protein [Acidobacteriota bacterium]